MRQYIGRDDLEAMVMNLDIYDVNQGGWEHEAKGLEANVDHTLTELVRAERKDFFDPKVVSEEVAPDTMQFALRLARWVGFRRELIVPTDETLYIADQTAMHMRVASRRMGAYLAARVSLAGFAHMLDHESERAAAQHNKFETLRKVSQALSLFALDSAHEFDFELRASLSNRLYVLRERFGIPQPG